MRFNGKTLNFKEENKMIKAIKDYNDMVYKPQIMWIKKHPIAYIVLSVTVAAATYLYMSKINDY